MITQDFIYSEDLDTVAVYSNGVFVETIPCLTLEDIENYSDGDYMQVRVRRSNSNLDNYILENDNWPIRLRVIRDIMEGSYDG